MPNHRLRRLTLRRLPWIAVPLLLMWSADGGAAGQDEAKPLRVLTYNLLHDGPWSGFFDNGTGLKDRLDMTIRELQALGPEVMALQEASDSRTHGNIPQQIAEALGLHVVFAPATDRIFGIGPLDRLIVGLMGFREGSAILSRFPIVESEIYDLPRCVRRLEPRIVLRATVAAPGGPLQVLSAHMAPGDECQLQRIGDLVEARRREGRTILMGDFNIAEDAPSLAQWRKRYEAVDVFRLANPDLPGFTVWQQIHKQESTTSRRVDFIFLVNGTPGVMAVESSRLALDRPGHSPGGSVLWPSDHRGVLADIRMPAVDDRSLSPEP